MRSFANLVHPQILGVWWSCYWPMPGPFPAPPPGKSALGTRLEINDAERNPNRRTISTKYFPHHCIPSKGRSSGWIATFQYALATSNLAISVPRHQARTPSITVSTETLHYEGRLGVAIVHAVPSGRGTVEDETPFTWLIVLGNDPKTADMQRRKRRG